MKKIKNLRLLIIICLIIPINNVLATPLTIEDIEEMAKIEVNGEIVNDNIYIVGKHIYRNIMSLEDIARGLATIDDDELGVILRSSTSSAWYNKTTNKEITDEEKPKIIKIEYIDEENLNDMLDLFNKSTSNEDIDKALKNVNKLGINVEQYNNFNEEIKEEVKNDLWKNIPSEGYTLSQLRSIFGEIIKTKQTIIAAENIFKNSQSLEDLSYITMIIERLDAINNNEQLKEIYLIDGQANILDIKEELINLKEQYEALDETTKNIVLKRTKGEEQNNFIVMKEALKISLMEINAAILYLNNINMPFDELVNSLLENNEKSLMFEMVEYYLDILGVDLEEYNKIDEAITRREIITDLLDTRNKEVGYTIEHLRKVFKAIIETKEIIEESINLFEIATPEEPLKDLKYITILLERYQIAENTYSYHANKRIEDLISKYDNLIELFNGLNQDVKALVLAKIDYTKTIDTNETIQALEEALNLVEHQLYALVIFNTSNNVAEIEEAIDIYANVLELDLNKYNEVQLTKQKETIITDLIANRPDDGYTLTQLKDMIEALVETSLITENAIELFKLEDNTEYVSKMINRFVKIKMNDNLSKIYLKHEKENITTLIENYQIIINQFNRLENSMQALIISVVDYSKATTVQEIVGALETAINNVLNEQETIITTLDLINKATNFEEMENAFINLQLLGINTSIYDNFNEERQITIQNNLIANRPTDGYTINNFKTIFAEMVQTSIIVEESLNTFSSASQVKPLEDLTYIQILINRFNDIINNESLKELYTIHSQTPMVDLITNYELLINEFNALNEEAQTLLLGQLDYTNNESSLTTIMEYENNLNLVRNLLGLIEQINQETIVANLKELLTTNQALLKLNLSAYNELALENQNIVVNSYLHNCPTDGYILSNYKTIFEEMIATSVIVEESTNIFNNALIVPLEDLTFIQMLIDRFNDIISNEEINNIYIAYGNVELTNLIDEYEDLITRFNALEENYQTMLLTTINYKETNAIDSFKTSLETVEQIRAKQIAITSALLAINEATNLETLSGLLTTNEDLLELDMDVYNELVLEIQNFILSDLIANRPTNGYTINNLKTIFAEIVQTSIIVEGSLNTFSSASESEPLEDVAYIQMLIDRFNNIISNEEINDIYMLHDGLNLTDLIAEYEGLINRFNALEENYQTMLLTTIDYNATNSIRAFESALNETEKQRTIDNTLLAINEATNLETLKALLTTNKDLLELNMDVYDELILENQNFILSDLKTNRPTNGYTINNLKTIFAEIINTSIIVEGSLNTFSSASSANPLLDATYIQMLINRFNNIISNEEIKDIYTLHDGMQITSLIGEYEALITRFEGLDNEIQKQVLRIINYNVELSLTNVINTFEQSLTIVEDELERLIAINTALTTINNFEGVVNEVETLMSNAEILELNPFAFEQLDISAQTSVIIDIVNNKSDGYNLETFQEYFNSIVSIYKAEQLVIDRAKVETITIDNIKQYVNLLKTAFEEASHNSYQLTTVSAMKDELTTIYNQLENLDTEQEIIVSQQITEVLSLEQLMEDLNTSITLINDSLDYLNSINMSLTELANNLVQNDEKTAMFEMIETYLDNLGVDLTEYKQITNIKRQRAVITDLLDVNNKGEQYTIKQLTTVFNAIVETRQEMEASVALFKDPLDINYLQMLVNQFNKIENIYSYHSGKEIAELKTKYQSLINRFTNLEPEIKTEVLATIDYTKTSSSTATINALEVAIDTVLQKHEIINQALLLFNTATTESEIATALEGATILEISMVEYDSLLADTKRDVRFDILQNRSNDGYDLTSLRNIISSIVETRKITEQSFNIFKSASSEEPLSNINYMQMLIDRFEVVSNNNEYAKHSNKNINTILTELGQLKIAFKQLDNFTQASVLSLIDYSATDTINALETAIEQVVGALTEINNYLTVNGYNDNLVAEAYNLYVSTKYNEAPATLENHLISLGIEIGESSPYAFLEKDGYNRKTAVFLDLFSNKPTNGYDLETLKTYFAEMVQTRLETQASMDSVNTVETLENIDYITNLFNHLETVTYQKHSAEMIVNKKAALESLITQYNELENAGKEIVHQKIIAERNKLPNSKFPRSLATIQALETAIAKVNTAFNYLNTNLTTNGASLVDENGKTLLFIGIEQNLKELNINFAAYDGLEEVGRQRAVITDLAANKGELYTISSLKEKFSAIVETRQVMEASVNIFKGVTPLNDIEYITMLKNRFNVAKDIYTYHSNKEITSLISELEQLENRFEQLDELTKTSVLSLIDYTKTTSSTATRNALQSALNKVETSLEAINTYLTVEGYSDNSEEGAYNLYVSTKYSNAPSTLENHLSILGLDISESSLYASLEKDGYNRKTAVFLDLFSNKPNTGYDSKTFNQYFAEMVQTRLKTQASMDLANGEINDITYVTMLFDHLKTVNYEKHSAELIVDKINLLESLVNEYNELEGVSQTKVIEKIIQIRNLLPNEKFPRSLSSIQALETALEQLEIEFLSAKVIFDNDTTTTGIIDENGELKFEVPSESKTTKVEFEFNKPLILPEGEEYIVNITLHKDGNEDITIPYGILQQSNRLLSIIPNEGMDETNWVADYATFNFYVDNIAITELKDKHENIYVLPIISVSEVE